MTKIETNVSLTCNEKMDPLLFKQYVTPLATKYTLEPIGKTKVSTKVKKATQEPTLLTILNDCYPLKGVWKWEQINDGTPDCILELFRKIHMSDHPVQIGDGGKILEEWSVDAEFTHPLYNRLYVFMNGKEIEATELSSETEVEIEAPEKRVYEKQVTISPPSRDDKWRDTNPLFNPRLIDDIEKGRLVQPPGVDVSKMVDVIDEIYPTDDLFITIDGQVVGRDFGSTIDEFGIAAKNKCMRTAKTVAFLRSIASQYSLDYDVAQYCDEMKKRKNIWEWIQVGPGHYRDFEWMLVGSRDQITKTIMTTKTKPLQKRASTIKEFDFDPSPIFTEIHGRCLNISTRKMIKRQDADQYGWCTDGSEKVGLIRAFIFNEFVKQYPETIIPGKTDEWAEEFFSALVPGEYIDFETLEPVKWSAASSKLYQFSKLGFAKKVSCDGWTMIELERIIKSR